MADANSMGESSDLFKLFVGQIPKEMDEASLRHYFEEFGPIVEISIIRDNITMVSKGCAFVTYSYEHSAQMAMDKLHDKVHLPNSVNALQVRFAETQVDKDNKLFIGMLPKTLGEQDLHDLFSMYGELREVHVIRGPEGGTKGCAFVKFVEREAAVAAIENLNDTIPAGATRPLVVKFADGKKPAGKDDPWQQQIPTYRSQQGGPMGHMGGQHMMAPPQQQRMMYPYPSMGQGAGQQMMGQSTSPYGQQQQQPVLGQHSPVPGMMQPVQGQQRYMYSQQPLSSVGGASGYYSSTGSALSPADSGADDAAKRSAPMYSQQGQQQQQQQDALMPPSTEGDFPSSPPSTSGAGPSGALAYEKGGLEVLPPPMSQQQQQQAQYPIDSESSHVRPPEGPSGANLFIYHLPRDLTDADLATLFAPFGNVISAKVFVDKKTSDSKGFGFVSYDTLENANNAIESMNGFQIGSKRLKVQHKRVMGGPQHHSPYGGGGGGGGGMHHPQSHHMAPHGQYPSHMQQQQPPQYGYRPSPLPGGTSGGMHGMMSAPMMSQPSHMQPQYGGGAMGGMQQGGMGMGAYGMRGSSGGMSAGGGGGMNRMQQPGPMAAPQGQGRGNYGYSYPTLNPYAPTAPSSYPQQQQRGMPSHMQQQPGSGRNDMYGSPSVQQPLGYPSPDQQQQHVLSVPGGQSTHGAISYMDAGGNVGKPQQQQAPNSGSAGLGFYGQY